MKYHQMIYRRLLIDKEYIKLSGYGNETLYLLIVLSLFITVHFPPPEF